MKLLLVTATEEDISAITEIHNACARELTALHGKGHWTYESTDKGVRFAMTRPKSKLLVAKHQNKVIGTLVLATKKPWAIDINYFTPVKQPLYLTGMAVHPKWQRKGVGGFMLKAIIPIVTEWPAQAIRLDAYDHAAGAGAFYSKCGYAERGHVKYKGNPLIYFEWLI